LIRFDSTYSLFFTAVISFYSVICLPLSTVPFQRSYQRSVFTTSSNHARPVSFIALLFESPFALMKAYC